MLLPTYVRAFYRDESDFLAAGNFSILFFPFKIRTGAFPVRTPKKKKLGIRGTQAAANREKNDLYRGSNEHC